MMRNKLRKQQQIMFLKTVGIQWFLDKVNFFVASIGNSIHRLLCNSLQRLRAGYAGSLSAIIQTLTLY